MGNSCEQAGRPTSQNLTWGRVVFADPLVHDHYHFQRHSSLDLVGRPGPKHKDIFVNDSASVRPGTHGTGPREGVNFAPIENGANSVMGGVANQDRHTTTLKLPAKICQPLLILPAEI